MSFSWLVDIAVFMRLLTDICSEVRYFSNRKSQPSGVRAPITNTAMVTSTGSLETKGFFYIESQAGEPGVVTIIIVIEGICLFVTDRMVPSESFHSLNSRVALATQGG